MNTINRSSHTELVSAPNKVCYDDHMLCLGVLTVYSLAAVKAFL
jgi:hypothetical protein